MEILIIAILIGLIPACIARKKGLSFGLWWLYGTLLFIVALPHALLASPLSGSQAALEHKALKKTAESVEIDFIADGVIQGLPIRYEHDGNIVALVNGRSIRFKNREDLESMLNAHTQRP